MKQARADGVIVIADPLVISLTLVERDEEQLDLFIRQTQYTSVEEGPLRRGKKSNSSEDLP